MSRNEYILSLAAANAHMTRYFCKELEDIMSVSYVCENNYIVPSHKLLKILSLQ